MNLGAAVFSMLNGDLHVTVVEGADGDEVLD